MGLTNQEVMDRLDAHSIKHQAVCREDGYKGPLRDKINVAYDDALDYGRLPGNGQKIVEVITIKTWKILKLE